MTGQPIPRVDGLCKVLGRTRFVADTALGGQACAQLVQATIPHGRVTAAHLKEAHAQPGVLLILTPDNCGKLNTLPTELTRDLPAERRPPLADWNVVYAGQHLALVVAITAETAAHAASLIRFEYEESPATLTPLESLHDPRPALHHGEIQRGAYQPDHFTKLEAEKLQYTRGAAPSHEHAALRSAATFTTPIVHHNPMECSATIASWHDGRLTVRDTTRWLLGSRKTLAAYFGLEEDHVRILCPFIGGSFGSKGFLWQHVALAAEAARQLAQPVRLELTRAQMFSSTGHRPRTLQQVTLAASAAGDLLSTEHHTLTETSTVAHFVEPAGLHSRNLYTSPHAAISHTIARTHLPTPVFMRAPGEAPGLFALECAMDELAYAATPPIDPLTLRLRNEAHRDQDGDKPYTAKHLRACHELGAERFGWSRRPAAPRSQRRANGVLIGQGMATATYPGRRMPASASATLNLDGCLTIRIATHEIGNGVRTVLTQLAADASGIAFDQVRVLTGDSSFPASPYTGASQTTATAGAAVAQAAALLGSRLCALAAEDPQSTLFGSSPQEISLHEGLLSRGTLHLPVGDLMKTQPRPLTVTAEAAPPDNIEEVTCQSFGAHFCEVEVDETFGQARITRWTAAFDGGRILNPLLARSQIMGGIVFAIGMTLMEETLYDGGRPLNANLGEYHLPTSADTPAMDIHFVESRDPTLNPQGTRGVGELGIVGAPAAIANAIFHATGRRHRQLPVKVEALMQSSAVSG